jgi:hypothetical protein
VAGDEGILCQARKGVLQTVAAKYTTERLMSQQAATTADMDSPMDLEARRRKPAAGPKLKTGPIFLGVRGASPARARTPGHFDLN